MQKKGVPTFFMDSGLTTNDYGWGTANFRKLGLVKARAPTLTLALALALALTLALALALALTLAPSP